MDLLAPPLTDSRPDADRARRALEVLRGLLELARTSAHFPEATALGSWLWVLLRPARLGRSPRIALRPSGFPSVRGLRQLYRLRDAARELSRDAVLPAETKKDSLTARLLSANLPPLASLTATLVSRGKGQTKLVLVHDGFDALGCPVRLSARLTQTKARHFAVDRDERVQVGASVEKAVGEQPGPSAEAVLETLRTLGGLTVEEVVRGQLGPVASALAGDSWAPLEAVVEEAPPGEAILPLTLERCGPCVASDADGHPFHPVDVSPEALRRRRSLGVHVSRELRLVCTPGVEAATRALLGKLGRPVIVRSR